LPVFVVNLQQEKASTLLLFTERLFCYHMTKTLTIPIPTLIHWRVSA